MVRERLIEVKAEENLRAKSLKTYVQNFSPKIAIRTSMSDYRKESWLINLPLYAIGQIQKEYELKTNEGYKDD